MNKFYHKIPIDNLDVIQKKVMEVTEGDFMVNNLFYSEDITKKILAIPQVDDLLKRLDLQDKIYGVAYNVNLSKTKVQIHRDFSFSTTQQPFKYSFNIPLRGCLNSCVNFYKSKSRGTIKYLFNEFDKTFVTYLRYDPKDCEIIDSVEMTEAHIVNVQEIHDVVNDGDQTRVMLLFRLKNDFDYESYVEKLEKGL
jgi:hypothetical protein